MKEEWKKLDSDAKLLVNAEEGAPVPIKIEVGNRDGCYRRLLTFLRIFVLLVMLIILSHIATSLMFNKNSVTQSILESDKKSFENEESSFRSQSNKFAFRDKVYESMKEENNKLKLNDAQGTTEAIHNIPRYDISRNDPVSNINPSIIVVQPFEENINRHFAEEHSIKEKPVWKLEPVMIPEFIEKLSSTIKPDNAFINEENRNKKILDSSLESNNYINQWLKLKTTLEKEASEITLLDQLINDFAVLEDDSFKSVGKSNEVMHPYIETIFKKPQDTSKASKAIDSEADIMGKFFMELANTFIINPDSKESDEQKDESSDYLNTEKQIISTELNESKIKINFNSDESKSSSKERPTFEGASTDSEERTEQLNSESFYDSNQEGKTEKDVVSFKPEYSEDPYLKFFASLINTQELTTTEPLCRKSSKDDISILVAKHLAPIVNEPMNFLKWYNENKDNPNFVTDNDKLKVYTAKILFSPDIEEYIHDSDIVSDLVIDDSFIEDCEKLLNSKEKKIEIESFVEAYIHTKIQTKILILNQITEGAMTVDDATRALTEIYQLEKMIANDSFNESPINQKNDEITEKMVKKMPYEKNSKVAKNQREAILEEMRKLGGFENSDALNAQRTLVIPEESVETSSTESEEKHNEANKDSLIYEGFLQNFEEKMKETDENQSENAEYLNKDKQIISSELDDSELKGYLVSDESKSNSKEKSVFEVEQIDSEEKNEQVNENNSSNSHPEDKMFEEWGSINKDNVAEENTSYSTQQNEVMKPDNRSTQEETDLVEGFQNSSQDTTTAEEKLPETLMNSEELPTIKITEKNIPVIDSFIYVKCLAPVVKNPYSFLSWYYKNKDDPNFITDNDKLKVYTAKMLFDTNVEEYIEDANIVSDHIIDDVCFDEFTEQLAHSKGKKVELNTYTEVYISNRLETKLLILEQIDNGAMTMVDAETSLRYINTIEMFQMDERYYTVNVRQLSSMGSFEEDSDEAERLRLALDAKRVAEQSAVVEEYAKKSAAGLDAQRQSLIDTIKLLSSAANIEQSTTDSQDNSRSSENVNTFDVIVDENEQNEEAIAEKTENSADSEQKLKESTNEPQQNMEPYIKENEEESQESKDMNDYLTRYFDDYIDEDY